MEVVCRLAALGSRRRAGTGPARRGDPGPHEPAAGRRTQLPAGLEVAVQPGALPPLLAAALTVAGHPVIQRESEDRHGPGTNARARAS